MINILFTDTHFGIKQNSQTWLKSQVDFIDNQLIPYIIEVSKQDKVRLIHLGDVFDSRSTISVLVASEVVRCFAELANLVEEFIIIGGNHDYYSPNQSKAHVDTLDLLFRYTDNITIVTENNNSIIYRPENNGSLFVGWYAWYGNIDEVIKSVEKYDVHTIYTHADIYGLTPGSIQIPDEFQGIKIYSGHIHTPNFSKSGLYNLGSCYALSFADCNQSRGFYIQRPNENTEFIPNTESIKFWRLHGVNELYNLIKKPKSKNDYIEIYLPREKIIDNRIQKVLKSLDYKNLWIIPEIDEGFLLERADMKNIDINNCIDKLVPANLKDKLEKVRERINQKEIC